MPDVNSLYPQAPAPTQGLLSGDPTKLLGLVGQLNQNALFQQQFKARKAIGEAYQGAIGDDGSIDQQKLMQGIRDNPDAGFMAGEASAGALSRTGQQIANTTAQLDQNSKQNSFLVDSLGSLADDPKLSYDKVRNVAVTMARNLKLPGDMVNGWLAGLPKDPAKLRDSLVQMRNLATGSAALSTPTGIGITDRGAPVTGTRGQFNYGASGGDNGGAAGPGSTAAPTGKPGIQTAPDPGFARAAETTGGASGEALAQARNRSLNYKQEVFPLEQAIPALEKLGKTGSGPGTEEFNHFKSFLQSAGIPGIDVSKIKNFDEAQKYLTDFVNQNGNTGTNDKLAASFAGNPSTKISNAAAVDVAKSALSLRRMKQAQQMEYEQSGKTDDQYAKFAGQWNASHDPRAFGFDMMTPKQRKDVISSIPEGVKRDQFMMQVENAHKNGIIGEPK